MSQRSSLVSSPARLLLSALLALGLCGCQTTGLEDITGALGVKSEKTREAKPDIDALRERYRATPSDPEIALQYGKALRENGQRSQAVAVLEQAVLTHANNKPLLAAYGRALADNGNFQQAFDVLNRAHTPEDPDWHILSAQGAVLDQLGRNEEAQQYYGSALKIVPDEPSVLSNLGLSYMLQNNLPKAEATLRRAHERAPQDARMRANLALVVGLQGRQAEAEGIVKADLPPDEAQAKVTALRQLLTKKQQRAEK
ncbi:tetratricopeptide repeat protein [Bradyrhizobium sp. CCGUVB1N3]|uniref:tetratricopeptide repeat protein n=1 Tax=Bradyrhizobium sp. CCGUVB1N3 TaxID=2949629 RepID=UPI0020B36A5C|nr:tetratricopeptide repeat protein [Bradyrhizobium sp. CCGUVB1N3]MCP3474528.1 tetratricopeptide repeat protein [Bradyrhizobium sp. CCGUVB1N3]